MMSIKSLLKVVIVGTIGAVISNTALANISDQSSTFCKPGFYVGLQGGRSDTFYHFYNTLNTAALNGAGNETIRSVDNSINNISIFTTTSTTQLRNVNIDDIGMGGRVYAGYQFNPYFAIEAGYTQYARTSFEADGITHQHQTTEGDNGFGFLPGNTTDTDSTTHYTGGVTERAVDLVAKGTLPLQHGFGLYAKAGAVYISADKYVNSGTVTSNQTVTGPFMPTDPNTPFILVSQTATRTETPRAVYTQSYQAFRPVAGAGINYTIPHTAMSVDASYTRVFSSGAIPDASLLALGLEYKFA